MRKMVEGTLKRYPQMSALEVAERCGVSDRFARQVNLVQYETGPAPTPDAPLSDVFPATEDDYVVRRDGKRRVNLANRETAPSVSTSAPLTA